VWISWASTSRSLWKDVWKSVWKKKSVELWKDARRKDA
jgi:hypothetical protein